MAASAEVERRVVRDAAASVAPASTVRALLEALKPTEDVYTIGSGSLGIRNDAGSPVLFAVTSAGVRTVDLVDESLSLVTRAAITGQDWTPTRPGEGLVECYGAQRQIILRIWLSDRAGATVLDQIDSFTAALGQIGIDNPRGSAN